MSRDFILLVFSWISFPPGPEYCIRTVSNFFENSRRYSQVKVYHQYQWHRRQIFPPVSQVLMLLVANLPPGSKIPGYQQHFGGKQWEQLSNCCQLKMNLKKKCIYMLTKEILNIFLIEDFFHLPPVSTTPVVHLQLRISPRIFEKIRNGPYGIIRGLGETDPWRKPEV